MDDTTSITSRGCSRAFILCVCYRALHHVSVKFASGLSVNFPFDEGDVKSWLVLGLNDCQDQRFQEHFGGTLLDNNDSRTYWTQSSQFCTWWKNNIERKKKRESLESDAEYEGSDSKLIARANYCRTVIAICLNIKFYFERKINAYGGVLTVPIPPIMPSHMPAPVPPPLFINRPQFMSRRATYSKATNEAIKSLVEQQPDRIFFTPIHTSDGDSDDKRRGRKRKASNSDDDHKGFNREPKEFIEFREFPEFKCQSPRGINMTENISYPSTPRELGPFIDSQKTLLGNVSTGLSVHDNTFFEDHMYDEYDVMLEKYIDTTKPATHTDVTSHMLGQDSHTSWFYEEFQS